MLRPWRTVVLGLAVAAAAAAQQGDAPLSGTKQELQELRERQKAAGASGTDMKDGLRSAVQSPAISFPTMETPSAPRMTPETLEKERRQRERARQNWLLNGMNRLGREAKDSPSTGRTAEIDPLESDAALVDEDEAGRIDTSDPAYLLKLYDRQKKAAEAKNTPPTSTTAATTRANDPLAPFLQNWLADSPVRDQALSSLGRPAGGGGSAGFSGLGSTTGTSGGATVAPIGGGNRPASSTPTAAAPNPYLTDTPLMPSLTAPLSTPVPPPSGPLLSPVSSPAPGQPVGPVLGPTSEPPPAPRRVVPPSPADDKKYFPQLKKF